jgi:ankyrin repeat protein
MIITSEQNITDFDVSIEDVISSLIIEIDDVNTGEKREILNVSRHFGTKTNIDEAKKYFDALKDKNIRDRMGNTALYSLLRLSDLDLEALKYFVDSGADVNYTNRDNKSALYELCLNKYATYEIMEYFVNKIDPKLLNLQTKSKGITPFNILVSNVYATEEMLQLFVDKGANINIRNHVGKLPLQYALSSNLLRNVTYLLKNNSVVNYADLFQDLMNFRRTYRIEIFKLFIDKLKYDIKNVGDDVEKYQIHRVLKSISENKDLFTEANINIPDGSNLSK